jgi:superoxide reductase
MNEQTADFKTEKHVPVIEQYKNGIVVKVGSVPHPMEEKHWIEWIQVIVDGVVLRKFLQPGEKPEARFDVVGKDIMAREYCNIHGLWKTR